MTSGDAEYNSKKVNVILIILYYVWCNGRNCMQKVYECNFRTTGI